MKITITGSLGHISKPLTQELVLKGHVVTVISRNPKRQKDIEALGATAAIGTMEDADFLSAAFKGADVVYVMEALGLDSFFDQNLDFRGAINKIGNNFRQAIQQSGVKRVVHLSSVGAHTNKDNGILAFHYNVENILKQLPNDVSITFMRPVGFYYNLYGFVNTIKTQGIIATNYGGDSKNPWVSPLDIATAIAEEIEMPFDGRKIRYVASDEISCNEIAAGLGEAIGKPNLKWIVISDEQLLNGMITAGMNPQIAAGLVEMNVSIQTGSLFEDYYLHRPILGKVKLTDFAKEFAIVYHSSQQA
ncbi:MAG: NmrA family NAD(P)-binding protein [Bacteroidetes bacterium]|nr:NmrA family NAD(P)-binding protein [Bacteroidota bacterium]